MKSSEVREYFMSTFMWPQIEQTAGDLGIDPLDLYRFIIEENYKRFPDGCRELKEINDYLEKYWKEIENNKENCI